MSESPGGAFIDQFKNWSIPLSDFPVSHKGKSDASESLYGGFVARQSRDISLRRPKGLASRRSGGKNPLRRAEHVQLSLNFGQGLFHPADFLLP